VCQNLKERSFVLLKEIQKHNINFCWILLFIVPIYSIIPINH
jgi:hypothetical protein